MGRKLKLANEDVIRKLIQLIQVGCYVSVAVEAVGIGYRSYFRWMEKGEKETSGIYRQFWQDIKKAESVAEAKLLMTIQEASNMNWTAAAWILERKFPERWGRKDRVQIEASVNQISSNTKKQDVIEWVAGMTDEEIQRFYDNPKILN